MSKPSRQHSTVPSAVAGGLEPLVPAVLLEGPHGSSSARRYPKSPSSSRPSSLSSASLPPKGSHSGVLLFFAVVATFVLTLFVSDAIHQMREANSKDERHFNALQLINDAAGGESAKGRAGDSLVVQSQAKGAGNMADSISNADAVEAGRLPARNMAPAAVNAEPAAIVSAQPRAKEVAPPPDASPQRQQQQEAEPTHHRIAAKTVSPPPACRLMGAERTARVPLPTCMMPALTPKRPHAAALWLAEKRRSDAAFAQLSAAEAARAVPPHLFNSPHGLTYFRPPYYGQPGLTFNGSMAAESLFVPYNEAEWDAYCRAAAGVRGNGVKEAEGQDYGTTKKSRAYGRIVVPDKVVYGLVNQLAGWEMEMLRAHTIPPLFRMQRRPSYVADRARDAKKKRESLQHAANATAGGDDEVQGDDPSAAANLSPIVLTLLMQTDGYGHYAGDIVADIAATIACLRQHLALWYEEDVINSVFMSHTATTGFYIANDQLAPPQNTLDVLNLYEMVRHGDWGYAAPDKAYPRRDALMGGTDGRHNMRVYRSGAQAMQGARQIGSRRALVEGGMPELERLWINIGDDMEKKHGPLRLFTDGPKESETAAAMRQLKRPFILPEIRTILGATDEFSKKYIPAAMWGRWAWGNVSRLQAFASSRIHEEEAKAMAISQSDEHGSAVLSAPAEAAIPRIGRTYLRQYAAMPLHNLAEGHFLSMNQVLLSFRGFRDGQMTLRRVLGGFEAEAKAYADAEVSAVGGEMMSVGSSVGESSSPSSYPRVADRRFVWSFFGEISRSKSDRLQMHAALTAASKARQWPHACCNSTAIEYYYSNSIFVPIGRGYFTLDCSRLYEAVAGGAIPVLVAPTIAEFGRSFAYAGGGPYLHPETDILGFSAEAVALNKTLVRRAPPFLYAATWELAAEAMARLVANPVALEERRLRCAKWFVNAHGFYQEALVYGFADGGLGAQHVAFPELRALREKILLLSRR